MTRLEGLLKQVTRAERIAKRALDVLTVKQLTSFAAQCREDRQRLHPAGATPDPVGLPMSCNDLCVGGKDR